MFTLWDVVDECTRRRRLDTVRDAAGRYSCDISQFYDPGDGDISTRVDLEVPFKKKTTANIREERKYIYFVVIPEMQALVK